MIAFLLALAATVAWTPRPSGSDAQLRGLAVLDATHAWASGASGTVLRTRDGRTWERLAVTGGEALDFRDIEALDANTIVLMSAGPGLQSRIYRSSDGGETWRQFHENRMKDGFYDAIAFWDASTGILLGDPVGGRFVVRITHDAGRTWYTPKYLVMPEALPGEGAFAASGTCLFALKGGSDAWFVTGGAKASRVFHSADRGLTWSAAEAPVPAGNPSSGLFSVAFLDSRRGFAAGGDYEVPGFTGVNGARTEDGGATWTPAPISASGFYSAVCPVPGSPDEIFAVGLGGSAFSRDAGRTWTRIDAAPWNAVSFSGPGVGWAVGPKGATGRSLPALR